MEYLIGAAIMGLVVLFALAAKADYEYKRYLLVSCAPRRKHSRNP